MEFTITEVVKRTAKRLNVSTTEVNRMLDTYADEYVKLSREADTPAPTAAQEAPVVPRKRNRRSKPKVMAEATTGEDQSA